MVEDSLQGHWNPRILKYNEATNYTLAMRMRKQTNIYDEEFHGFSHLSGFPFPAAGLLLLGMI